MGNPRLSLALHVVRRYGTPFLGGKRLVWRVLFGLIGMFVSTDTKRT